MHSNQSALPVCYAGRQSAYPIGALLLEAWRMSRLSLGHFVTAIGYGNAAKGCRAFDTWLESGEGSSTLLDRLGTSPWAPPADRILQAVEATRRQCLAERDERARLAFRPMVQVRPRERRPSSITLHGLCGGTARLTRVLPDDVAERPVEVQDRHVRAFAEDFSRRFGDRDPFFGPLTGYLLFLRYGEAPWLFTPQADRVGRVEAIPLGTSRISVGGHEIPNRLFQGGAREGRDSRP
jgi:hypothetical protein